MSRIIAIIAIAGALFTQSSSVLLAGEAEKFTGAYYCEGIDASGNAYRGRTLIDKQGDVYYVQWTLGGRLTAIGIGVAKGDSLAVSYYGPSTGVVLYTRTEAGLDGQWTQPGAEGATFSETLKRIPDEELQQESPAPERAPGPTAIPGPRAPDRSV